MPLPLIPAIAGGVLLAKVAEKGITAAATKVGEWNDARKDAKAKKEAEQKSEKK